MERTLPFEQRDQFEELLKSRELPPEAFDLLALMHQAANGTGPMGVVGRFKQEPEPLYLMECALGQMALSHYCHLKSSSQFRAICERLERSGIFRRVTEPGETGRRTVYVLRLSKLLETPIRQQESAVDHVSEKIDKDGLGRLFGEKPDAEFEQPAQPEQNPELAREIFARLSAMNGNNERLMFSSIDDEHVRLIGGFATPVTGGRIPTISERVALFARYWQDVKLREREVTSTECIELLALFLNKARNKPRKTNSKNPRGAAVNAWWRNRRTMPLINTVKAEVLEATKMLREHTTPAEPVAQQSVPVPNGAAMRPSVIPPAAVLPQEPRLGRLNLGRFAQGIEAGRRIVHGEG